MTPSSKAHSENRFVLFVMALAACVILLQRWHTFPEPLECDTALFSVLAHEWNFGRPLYSDLWDNKPPGLIVTYAAAQRVAGFGSGSIFLLGAAASLLTSLGIYFATFWMTGNKRAGLWATAFWVIVNATPYLEANQPLAEVFVNASWVWGVAWTFRAGRQGRKESDLWMAGSFFALASFYKHHIALANGIIALGFLAARMKRRTVWPLLIPTGALWIGLFFYFSVTQRLRIFWDTLVRYSLSYAEGQHGGLFSNLFTSIQPGQLASGFRQGVFHVIIPLALAALLGFRLAFQSKDRRWIFLGGYLIAAWFAMAVPGRFYPHYYQLLLPPLAIAAGALAHFTSAWWPTVLLCFLVMEEGPFYRRDAAAWSRLKYGEVYLTVKKMGEEIGNNLLPGETFYEVGYEPGLYYYSRRSPPTGILLADHWEAGPSQKPFTERIRNDLDRQRPELLVTTRFWMEAPGNAEQPLMQWCLERYRPLPKEFHRGPFLLFSRKGGRLEARLTSKTGKADRHTD